MLSFIFFVASAFSGYESVYHHNRFFYELYLSSDEPLTDLGYIHLIGLRHLIDLRLDGVNEETIMGDKHLSHEYLKRYSFHLEYTKSGYKEIIDFLKNSPKQYTQ